MNNASTDKPQHSASKTNGAPSQPGDIQAAGRTTVSKRPNSGKPGSAKAALGPTANGKSKGTTVASRYMQAAERASLSKSTSLNDSEGKVKKFVSPKPSSAKLRVGTPPRYSMGTPTFGKSKGPHPMYKTFLQSTFSEGHCNRPDFDISDIEGKAVLKSAKEADSCPQDKWWIEKQALLLTFLTAKMEHNTDKLKAKEEARLLHMMEVDEALYSEMMEKKRQYLLMEKRRLANELLDLQISALTPVAEAAKDFTESYKTLASAVDTTRHELPVKNFHIAGDRREFLSKAEASLQESEVLLRECTEGNYEDNRAVLECLKGIKSSSKDLKQEMVGVTSELLELSSLVSRRNVLTQMAVEEEKLGAARTLELFCKKISS
ncbi:HAUS augmin-like complex subunit 8 isoform X2 [Corythoichthys intestinalis]|nr:HAUS augmin-like complex subunit 8 isoform X2 [Corythoichthys intestinalis]